MSFIKWFNIYCKPWFEADVATHTFRVDLVGGEKKRLNDLIRINEYETDQRIYIKKNVDCFLSSY